MEFYNRQLYSRPILRRIFYNTNHPHYGCTYQSKRIMEPRPPTSVSLLSSFISLAEKLKIASWFALDQSVTYRWKAIEWESHVTKYDHYKSISTYCVSLLKLLSVFTVYTSTHITINNLFACSFFSLLTYFLSSFTAWECFNLI